MVHVTWAVVVTTAHAACNSDRLQYCCEDKSGRVGGINRSWQRSTSNPALCPNSLPTLPVSSPCRPPLPAATGTRDAHRSPLRHQLCDHGRRDRPSQPTVGTTACVSAKGEDGDQGPALRLQLISLRSQLLSLRLQLLSLRLQLLSLRSQLLSLRLQLLSLRSQLLSLRSQLLSLRSQLLSLRLQLLAHGCLVLLLTKGV